MPAAAYNSFSDRLLQICIKLTELRDLPSYEEPVRNASFHCKMLRLNSEPRRPSSVGSFDVG